jgi:hypothetical protein
MCRQGSSDGTPQPDELWYPGIHLAYIIGAMS